MLVIDDVDSEWLWMMVMIDDGDDDDGGSDVDDVDRDAEWG